MLKIGDVQETEKERDKNNAAMFHEIAQVPDASHGAPPPGLRPPLRVQGLCADTGTTTPEHDHFSFRTLRR